ncbi:hypothetical protein C1886_18820, partial [Pseudomonas sp. FW300-N1A1]
PDKAMVVCQKKPGDRFGAAMQPSASKLARHGFGIPGFAMTVDSLAAKYAFHSSVNAAFVARELAPAGLRSGPGKAIVLCQKKPGDRFGAAMQPSASKLARHMKA